MRLALPTRLNHVNVYLLEDVGGWTIFDTGMAAPVCIEGWERAFSGVLSGRPIARVIVSHFHRDHVGLAGWLCEKFEADLFMSRAEYLLSRVFQADAGNDRVAQQQAQFYKNCGLDRETAEIISREWLKARSAQASLPTAFDRLRAGNVLRIGSRDWQIMTGAGHAHEQVMLYSAADEILISADQILPEITPNISVASMQPNANPIEDFLKSLHQVRTAVSNEALVLPGHRRPFFGLHDRIDELEKHHASRCDIVLGACRDRPLSGFDLVPIVFERTFGVEAIGPAIGETLSHINFLMQQGRLTAERAADGALLYRTST